MRRIFLVFTENSLNNELNNIHKITFNNNFKVKQINKLILDIANDEKSKNKYD